MPAPGNGPSVEALGYRPALDGVRGIAVALVVAFHYFNWPRNGGALGVELFFVLSGFLISTLLLEEHARTGSISLRHFYIRRALRLLPLLYLSLAVVTAVVLVAAVDRGWYLRSIASSALYVGNLYGVVAAENDLAPAIGHLWSLGVEEQFYLVWPVVFLAILRWVPQRATVIVAAAAVAAIALRAALLARGETVWTLPTTYADALLAGCLLALWRRSGRRLPPIGVLAIAVLVVSMLPGLVDLDDAGGLLYLWPVAFGSVLVVAGVADPAWLRHPWLVTLGGISYGVYVIHVPAWFALHVLTDESGWMIGVVATVLTLAVAYASRRTIEAWFLQRKPEPPGRSALVDLPGPT